MMKTEQNILIAFVLNLVFSAIELVGGLLTGSVAIISDSVHDFGDALSIGISYFLERKSRKRPNAKYTYGYARFSVLGAVVTAGILLVGSTIIVFQAVSRFFEPTEIHFDGMLWLAVLGVIVNFAAAWRTHGKGSLNQRSVNLHMLEDTLGWVVVLVGTIIMRFTGWVWIDPLMSIGVAIFILIQVCRNLSAVLDLFLVRTPRDLNIAEVTRTLEAIEGVENVHHLHVWSLDGERYYATLHAQAEASSKDAMREALKKFKIHHVTMELEAPGEKCGEESCREYRGGGHGGHNGHKH